MCVGVIVCVCVCVCVYKSQLLVGIKLLLCTLVQFCHFSLASQNAQEMKES